MSGLGGGGLKTGGGGGGAVTLSGDVVGLSSATVVEAIYGSPVSATPPTTNQVLLFNGTQYVPTTLQAGGSLRATSGAPVIISSDLQYDYAIDETAGILYQLTGAGPYTISTTWATYGQSAFTILANPMTTAGDIIYGGASGAVTRLAAGTSGYALTTQGAGSAPIWAAVLANPMTTAGDMIQGGSGGAPTRLALGTAYQGLLVNSAATAAAWAPSPTSVLTAAGDILYASSANTLARLGIGAAGSKLYTVSGTTPSWASYYTGVTAVVAGTISSPVTLTATTAVTMFTTGTINAGTWQLLFQGLITGPALASVTGLEMYLGAGSAVISSTLGASSAEVDFGLASADIPFSFLVTIVVGTAGTVILTGYNNSGSNATLQSSTQGTAAKAGVSGYTAVRIA